MKVSLKLMIELTMMRTTPINRRKEDDDGEKELLVGLGKSSNEEVVEYVTDNDADKLLVNFLDSSEGNLNLVKYSSISLSEPS